MPLVYVVYDIAKVRDANCNAICAPGKGNASHTFENVNIAVCKTVMPPFPNIWRIGLTFDTDLWPTDLNINRGHLLIKDYLPTKFEASGAKRSWVISCTRWSKLAWPLTLTFDLLTWISIGIIYSPRTIYLPSLKLLGQSVLELSVAQGEVN